MKTAQFSLFMIPVKNEVIPPSSRLAIVISHPIQYHIPWLKGLTDRNVKIKVFYTWSQSENKAIYDTGFGRNIKWDIPLLEGYDSQFIKNTSKKPGSDNFFGIINPSIIQEIEKWEPDCLMVNGWNYHSHLKCLLHFHKKLPIIFAGDSTLLNESNSLKKLARRIFLKWIYKHVDYVCYAGRHNMNYFIKHGVNNEQMIYLPHAIDINRFAEPNLEYEQNAKKWRDDISIPENHLVVLYAGKLINIKNPMYLLKLAEACKNLPVTILIVGNGSMENKLKQESKKMGNVKFLDFQNQKMMPIVYRMGDVFILPSTNETWGMCISEAMACGRPVMVSKMVGCVIDMVEENKTGISFHSQEIEKCVEFIGKLNSNRILAKEMGLNARKKIYNFSVENRIEKLFGILKFMESKKVKKTVIAKFEMSDSR